MNPAFLTRLTTFAQHGQPTAYGGSEMMRADLTALLAAVEKISTARGSRSEEASGDAGAPAVEPVAWESRFWMDGYGGEPIGWSEWKRIPPQSALCTMNDSIQDFRDLNVRRHKYEVRSLPATPTGDPAQAATSESVAWEWRAKHPQTREVIGPWVPCSEKAAERARAAGYEVRAKQVGECAKCRDLRDSLRTLVELCAIGDVDENTEAHGWGDAIKRAKALMEAGGER